MATDDLLGSLGLDALVGEVEFGRDANGLMSDPAGARVVFAAAETMRALHLVLEGERSGGWRSVLKATGQTCGRTIASTLEARLAALGKPPLAQLPLEACLLLLERKFALHGWGVLQVDLADATVHGLVVAKLQHSLFAEALSGVNDFVDAYVGGMLQAFFEHITGQSLACEEIGCARRHAAACTFVVAPAERLAPVMGRIGRDGADALLARLRA